MKKFFLVSTIAVFLLSFIGCMTVNLTSEGIDKPVSMTNNVNQQNFTVIKHIKRDVKGIFTLFNLVTISDTKINDILRSELQASQGDAVINVKIKGQTTLVDGAIPLAATFVGSLISPVVGFLAAYMIGLRTYTVEGDIIRYSD